MTALVAPQSPTPYCQSVRPARQRRRRPIPFPALDAGDSELLGTDDEPAEAFDPRDQVRRGPGGGAVRPRPTLTKAKLKKLPRKPPRRRNRHLPNPRRVKKSLRLLSPRKAALVQTSSAEDRSTVIGNGRLGNDERALNFLRGNTDFTKELDTLRKKIDEAAVIDQTVVSSGVVMATSLSVGYVVWMTRGGLLLLSLVSSMPAWRLVDPIPVLGRLRDKRDEQEDEAAESLRSLVEGEKAEAIPTRMPRASVRGLSATSIPRRGNKSWPFVRLQLAY